MEPIQATPPVAAAPTSDPYTEFYSSQQFSASEDNLSRTALSTNSSDDSAAEQMKEAIGDPDGTTYVIT